ncbi:MAG TPA: hypothetical protein VFU21_08340 [Kofleriaceae bacterium]|nr:hypothetical protein [Kofleriaceae bacterium]
MRTPLWLSLALVVAVAFTLTLALALAVTGSAAAAPGGEPAASVEAVTPHVEVSPPMLLLRGFGVEAGVKIRRRFEIGAALFTLTIPEAFQGDNKDEDWDIRDTGGGVMARWHLREDGRGLFLGAVLEAQNHALSRAGESMDSLELGVAGQVGYQWFPIGGSSFYIRPSLLVVAPLYLSEERELAGETFEEPLPVRFVPLVYTGFEL